MALPGNISFMSQSGAFCTAVLDWANEVGMGFNHFVSLGNKAVLDEIDLIEEWNRDRNTDVILGYLEGIERGAKFIEVAEEVTKDTPIIVVKSGKTDEGASAAASHTGTITGSEDAYDAAFTQSGVIRAENIEELFDFGSILAHQKPPQNKKVGILTNAGGPGVMAADALDGYGLELAELQKETLEKLEGVLSSLASRKNPIDLTGKADEEDYREALSYIIEDENVGAVLAMSAPAAIFSYPELTEILADARKKTDKPIVGTLMGGQLEPEAQENLKTAGVPNYFDPARAVRSLSVLVKYGEIQQKEKSAPPDFSVDREAAASKIRKARSAGTRTLGLESMEILEDYGIPALSAALARSAEEAEELASGFNSSAVLKVDSPDIIHKSDAGGVKVGVKLAEIRQQFDHMMNTLKNNRPEAEINGIRVQETGEGEEVIIGLNRDHQFGPLIMFGLGGVYVEVLEDVAYRVAPVSPLQAREMIRSIKGYPILKGIRGNPGVDIESLVDIVLRVSGLAVDNPEITELDLNPIIASPDCARVADVRMSLTK